MCNSQAVLIILDIFQKNGFSYKINTILKSERIVFDFSAHDRQANLTSAMAAVPVICFGYQVQSHSIQNQLNIIVCSIFSLFVLQYSFSVVDLCYFSRISFTLKSYHFVNFLSPNAIACRKS